MHLSDFIAAATVFACLIALIFFGAEVLLRLLP